ncbi:NADH:ubiquinone oxidoreductase, subunit G, iron-sulfur binding protein [Arcobacter nitrofigilis DSM 7299]|uniref:NADH:ubiquinone oxidoreductase, subunit G, iron-sulfur binding protein n=1 Tax=Arcobacter nitrofigilis (strain ATCC 33309 / DSM 7299 / CCUG 15893 / LMG 7604 / NCTC 12251 / CI) TaxID=572480 RepID=D5V7K1_ARCNC|nr:NADH-quinone oxidoreductase subunit G [Arcobacter nitrofigilis]ADG94621.1 NADH:ubiquinone oxidoreductase, subunit G, iron-sulfur binding protein [Arcobacter nitrofigilis DSM 7299]
MSELITLTIDGKELKAKEGDSVLNIARANGIFIPAICYLTRCSPTLACRLCLVESDGKQIYACNSKAKDGMNITTTTENIEKERRAVMEVYDVNHPLQCGVCDQSGDCELQNYTLYQKVDSQSYAIRDVNRPREHWGVMNYDPGLCIVCEKCVTVCKDMIGSNALSTVKRGAEALPGKFKATMPKDAYAMWNKLNKSLIGFEEDKCVDCGECISVCPVGALVSNDFQYKSNSWELTKIPAANPHSSDCALLYYEVKHESIVNHNVQKIYRVTNEHHYASINGAARFGYDFENRVESQDEIAFDKAIEAFKKADTIKFNSFITNEEALILQKLKEKFAYKLVNSDALAYKKFLEAYASVSGKSLYSADLKDIHNSNFVISVGSYLKSDSPNTKYAFNNSVVMNKGAGLYFHPMGDPVMEQCGKRGKTTEFIYHKPLAEESILYFILDRFGEDLPEAIQTTLNSYKETRLKSVTEMIKEKVVSIVKDEESGEEKEVTKMVPKKVTKEVEYEYTRLLDEINADATLLETIEAMKDKKDSYTLILGEDLITHPNSQNLAKLAAIVEKYTQFKVVTIPTSTNTLGVSLICDLDEEEGSYCVGYNVKADFQLSALGDGDLDMPALNQQEGTFTNIDKRVVPTNAALPYKGYVLNDIANSLLGTEVEHTISYTKSLPVDKGFQAVEFDSLTNYFANDWSENRGYILNTFDVEASDEIAQKQNVSFEVASSEITIYKANPINQFNEFTAIAHEFKDNLESGMFANEAFLEELELSAGDKVLLSANGTEVEVSVYTDNQVSGKIAYVSSFEKELNTKALFSGYRFTSANVKKV